MEIRVYHDTRKKYRDYVDSMTLMFPVPKRLQKRENCRAYCVGGNISHGRWFGRDSFNIPIGVNVNTPCCYLGKRIKLSTLPQAVQDEIKHCSDLWNDAVNKDTEEAWERWNND